jgi:hypothetical protein
VALKKAFLSLAATEETPVSEGTVAVEEELVAPKVAAKADLLGELAKKAGMSRDEFTLIVEGLATDLAHRNVPKTVIARKTFVSPREALGWLAFAAHWSSDNSKSLKARAARLKSAAAGWWPRARSAAVVVLPDGKAGIDLSVVESAFEKELEARAALMAVPVGTVYTGEAVPLDGGVAKCTFWVDDNSALRVPLAAVTGTLWFDYGNGVEVEGASFPLAFLDAHFSVSGLAADSNEIARVRNAFFAGAKYDPDDWV